MHFLHLAEYWYNISYHSSIHMLPFQALFGRSPPSTRDYLDGAASVATLDTLLLERRDYFVAARYHLSWARQRMKSQADKHRQFVTFCHWRLGSPPPAPLSTTLRLSPHFGKAQSSTLRALLHSPPHRSGGLRVGSTG
ncbi:UNVERIFIED_CONTAM: hypothetical protein Scaly_0107500 [Sesamum calycinum]|uniref:Uncharacterized protein n=1 Tax=Sesamum calycinum TaxID=2727403 RepID=A0AAW2SVC7_9LAMI